MFEKLRKPGRAKNILAYVIFGSICLVFVFLSNVPGGGGLTPGGPVAIVNKEPILFSDYREIYSRLQEQYRAGLDTLPAAQRQMYMDNLRNEALEQLINSLVISQAAHGLGMYTSDDEVRDFIMDVPAFKEEERFRRERYDNYLKYRNITAEKFEKEIRKDLANKQIIKQFEMSLTPSKMAVDFNKKLEQYKLNVAFVRFSDNQIRNSLKVNDKELLDFSSNPQNDQELKDYYTTNKNKYEEQEQVKARHILVKFDESKPEDIENALKKINEIKKRSETEDFAKLAEELSDDPGSKSKGGDLGYFTRGRMVPEFEDVAFTQKLNIVSEPVKSQFGYHLIKVEEKKEATSKTFEDVKKEVAKELILDKKLKDHKVEVLNWLKEGNEKAISLWLKQNNLSWQDTGEFSLNSQYIPKLSGLGEGEIKKLFKLASEKNKWMNEIIELDGQNYLVKFNSFKESPLEAKADTLMNFEKARDQSVNDIFKNWLDEKKEAALIERNPLVLRQ
ncbi:MAG: SurA N-terminal domain-containing protein [Bdellovibrionaceae bacterium]|nr:SurA N-terminal domain-containing protein [Pseudobdellovibrionaceae bacterium]